MKVIYDRETDTLAIILRPGKVAERDEPRPGLILDFDKGGRLDSRSELPLMLRSRFKGRSP